MSTAAFTVLIAARNAASTIGRAVRSVRDEADAILLIDDGSTDETVAAAREAGGDRLSIVRRDTGRATGGPMGATRQLGLDRVETPFAAWLDADDEFTPGRIARLVRGLESGADVAADETTLIDGASGARLGDVRLPAWARDRALPARLFGRNALPAIGLVGFRTAAWCALGYDAAFHGAEDVDILLRGIAARLRFHWIGETGTRVHVYPSSLSRQREQQRASYARALRKHRYDDVRALLAEAGWSAAIAARTLASMAMFRDEPRRVLEFLDAAEHAETERTWAVSFMRGTALLLAGDTAEAIERLRAADTLMPMPETLNNLGVALARAGRIEESRDAFRESLQRRADYQDARVNLDAGAPHRVTTHPLRGWDTDTDAAELHRPTAAGQAAAPNVARPTV